MLQLLLDEISDIQLTDIVQNMTKNLNHNFYLKIKSPALCGALNY